MEGYRTYSYLVMLLLSLISVRFGSSRQQKGLTPLVSFGTLTEVVLKNYTLHIVEDIIPDLRNPGGLIVGDNYAVIEIAPDLTVKNIAGKPHATKFLNEVGESAGFGTVQGILQFKNGTETLVADKTNHCIRRVVIATRTVTTFAGRCKTNVGDVDGPVPAQEAVLQDPSKIIYDEEKNLLYYLLRRSVVEHDLDTDIISPVVSGLAWTSSFVIDSTKRYLYVTHISEEGHGISKIDIVDKTTTSLTSQSSSTSLAGIDDLTDLTWLIPDQVLLIYEYSNEKLTLVNLYDDQVTTICTGNSVSELKMFPSGHTSTCPVSYSFVVTVIDEVIYIGVYSTQQSRSFILRLPYSQPVCGPPEVESNSSYTPVKDRYTHSETVIFECQEGYGIEDAYDIISCVRDLHPNGTVLGKWGKPSPKCAPVNLQSISPEEGQSAGGTFITAKGIFSKNLTIFINYGNYINQQISTIQSDIGEDVHFRMPPNQVNSTSSICTIRFLQSGGVVHERVYKYLPNPKIIKVSRTAVIVSGGVDVRLYGEHLASAQVYKLQLWFPCPTISTNQAVINLTCAKHENHVTCEMPDLTDQYTNLKKSSEYGNKGTEGSLVKCRLIGDEHIVDINGFEEFDLAVSDSKPSLERLTAATVISATGFINLNGSHLNTSLLPSDYRVTLIFPELSQNRSCKVTRLQFDLLRCQPILEGISVSQLHDSWRVEIEVEVGGVNLPVGRVSIDLSPPTTETQTLNPKPPLSAAQIALPVSMSVIVIASFSILAVCIIRRRNIRRRREFEERSAAGPVEPQKKMEELSWQQKLPDELRLTLEDMYIEPSCLTFSIKAHEIGKGHFGKVYVGQLALGNNALKTVAVKSLRETEDVTLDQVIDFLEEATFIKDFKHVNILPTLGIVWREGDRPLVVLPYMALGDLQSLLRHSDAKYPAGDLLHFGLQIAAGMEFLTYNRLLHKDLAARNCLVDDKYLVKIADFGMSKDVYAEDYQIAEGTTKPRPVKWMAIETLISGVYNSSTEVWSFGVLMWELFADGNTPYPGISNSEVLFHLKQGYRLNRPPDMPPALFNYVATFWLEAAESRPLFADIKHVFNQILFHRGNHVVLPSETSDVEEFQYSYVRQLTNQIPEYYDSCDENDLQSGKRGYVDNPYIASDYKDQSFEKLNSDSSKKTGAYIVTESLLVSPTRYTVVQSQIAASNDPHTLYLNEPDSKDTVSSDTRCEPLSEQPTKDELDVQEVKKDTGYFIPVSNIQNTQNA